jgi:flagellin-specific chaperone FliS
METATQQITGRYESEVAELTLSAEQKALARETGSREAITLAANAYRREHLLNLTPVQVVKKLYDTAIFSLKNKDYDLAHRAISQLIIGLNFDYEELATGLLGLYMYIKECIRKNNIAEATDLLEELREAWAQAFKL